MSTKKFVARHGLDANFNTISNVADPVNSSDVATKSVTDVIDTKAGLAFDTANTGVSIAQAAFDSSNTKFSSSGGIVSGDVDVVGSLTVEGDFVISGNVTTISANNLVVQDNMIYLNENGSTSTNPDLGIAGAYNDGTYHHTGIFRDSTDGYWKVFDNYEPEPDASPYIDTTHATFRIANFQANTITGSLFSGSGASLTNLPASNLSGTIPSGVLGNSSLYVGTTAIALNRSSGSQTLTGVSVDGNAATATALQTARTIGGVSFNGTANINLPGVNTAGNQNTSGNAATATTLQTARTINGTSFNGSANITTANWGTARTLTIGSTGKSVNGSGNVSWSLAEIGAAATSHTHSYLPLSGGTVTGYAYFEGPILWKVSSSDTAHQRADARDDATNYSRLHWYGVSNAAATSNFRHAWYDGAAYINIDASSSNINFARTTGTANLQVHGNTVLHAGNYNSYSPTLTGGGASGSWGISVTGNAATATTATNTSGGTVNANYIGISNTSGSTGYGISLYAGATTSGAPNYGLFFGQTATFGTYGTVSSDWATYFTTNNTANRGWIFRNNATPTNIASINNSGSASFAADVRAPIFYDSNNTGYYFNGASTTNLYTVQAADAFRSDRYEEGDGTFLFSAGVTSGATRHINLSDSTTDPASAVCSTGITWGQRTDSNPYYMIYTKNAYNNGYSTHTRLTLAWHTGLEIGASSSYGGTRFFNNSPFTGSEIMRVGSGNNNVYINYIGQAGSDFRAPIFYDSNNTGYYIDAAGNNRINTLLANRVYPCYDNSTAIYLDYPTGNYGSVQVNGSGAGNWEGFSIDGRAVFMHDGGTATGIYNDVNNQWLLYAIHGGESRMYYNGVQTFTAYNNYTQSAGSSRAPIFYDSNDTGYYVDPSSNSKVSNLYSTGWFRNYGTQGIYNQDYGVHFYGQDSEGYCVTGSGGIVKLIFRSNHQSTVRGYVYGDTSNNFGFLNNGGSWILRVIGGDYAQAEGTSMRAKLYYDSNDTAYYVDPNSTSVTSQRIRGGTVYGPNILDSYLQIGGNSREYVDNVSYASVAVSNGNLHIDAAAGHSIYLNYYDGVNVYFGNGTGGVNAVVNSLGQAFFTSFYDYNNSAYYCDPNSVSYLYYVHCGNSAGTTANGTDASQLQVQNTSGTGDNDVAAISFHCGGHYGTKLHLRHDSLFGVGGWSASSWRWYVQLTTGNMTAAGSVTQYSDKRLKEEINPLENSLSKLLSLNGVSFRWKNLPEIVGHPGKIDFGIIAQEVEKVFPEVIHESAHTSEDGDKYKTVAYGKLVPVLIEAIKEQQTQLEQQQETINKLKSLLNLE